MFTVSGTMLRIDTILLNLHNTIEYYYFYFIKQKTEKLNTLRKVAPVMSRIQAQAILTIGLSYHAPHYNLSQALYIVNWSKCWMSYLFKSLATPSIPNSTQCMWVHTSCLLLEWVTWRRNEFTWEDKRQSLGPRPLLQKTGSLDSKVAKRSWRGRHMRGSTVGFWASPKITLELSSCKEPLSPQPRMPCPPRSASPPSQPSSKVACSPTLKLPILSLGAEPFLPQLCSHCSSYTQHITLHLWACLSLHTMRSSNAELSVSGPSTVTCRVGTQ